METYIQMKKRHEEEFGKIPLGFAFSTEQFEKMMAGWGLTPEDTDKICKVPHGGFIQKKDKDLLVDCLKKHSAEEKAAIVADTDGTGYIAQMFEYELCNHEYGYTLEIDDTLDALNLTIEEVEATPALKNGLRIARNRIHKREGISWGVE